MSNTPSTITNSRLNRLIFVDCEGHGPAPTLNSNSAFEFGAVHYKSGDTFHGKGGTRDTFHRFEAWLIEHVGTDRPVFMSDNPAYDWQFINYYFHLFTKKNPFGWSARRIGDFYAGLRNDFEDTQLWKRLRITAHDHNPVHDALGNAEAFRRMTAGER